MGCARIDYSLNFNPAPRWNVCPHVSQFGGGLGIQGGGTATLTDTNVYKNQATGNVGVCSPFEPSSTAPRWNVTRADGWQNGGGLYIWDTATATLTNTNVYDNRAGLVCSPFLEP